MTKVKVLWPNALLANALYEINLHHGTGEIIMIDFDQQRVLVREAPRRLFERHYSEKSGVVRFRKHSKKYL